MITKPKLLLYSQYLLHEHMLLLKQLCYHGNVSRCLGQPQLLSCSIFKVPATLHLPGLGVDLLPVVTGYGLLIGIGEEISQGQRNIMICQRLISFFLVFGLSAK